MMYSAWENKLQIGVILQEPELRAFFRILLPKLWYLLSIKSPLIKENVFSYFINKFNIYTTASTCVLSVIILWVMDA